jgi:nucleoside-diphosphate-sugar epimerase
MPVFIAGVDGYLGWTLACHLGVRGHDVGGVDLFLRRDWVAEVGGQSVTPIRRMTERLEAYRDSFKRNLVFRKGDLRDYNFVVNCLRSFVRLQADPRRRGRAPDHAHRPPHVPEADRGPGRGSRARRPMGWHAEAIHVPPLVILRVR